VYSADGRTLAHGRGGGDSLAEGAALFPPYACFEAKLVQIAEANLKP
jgi:hypothetical protein